MPWITVQKCHRRFTKWNQWKKSNGHRSLRQIAAVARQTTQSQDTVRKLIFLEFLSDYGNDDQIAHFFCFYSVVRNTRNPVYDEDFTFYGLSMAEVQAISLHFVVLSFDRYSRDDVIGEVILPLTEVDLNQVESEQLAFCKEIQPRSLKVCTKVSAAFLVK